VSQLFVHRPATTVLHRLPGGAKLAGLAVASIVVAAVPGPVSAVVALAVALGLLAWSRTGWGAVLRTLRGLLLVLALLAAIQVWQSGWARAVETVADLLALVLLALVVTTTTPVQEILDAVTTALRPLERTPFRRLGVRPERVALAFSLVLRMVPTAIDIAGQTRDAARARGLERDPRARLAPTVVRMVAHARTTGDALWARGLTEEDHEGSEDDRDDR